MERISWLTMPERIRGLYSRAGHTRDSFAAAIQMHHETLEHFERFEDVPLLIELGELANELHVSKRFLCFGEYQLQAGHRGEPPLTESGIQSVLAEVGALEIERQTLNRYRSLTNDGRGYSRTFVLMFVRALRSALNSGADVEVAMTRAMVVATQAHTLSRAVAQGIRPVRPEQITPPPLTLSSGAQAEHLAAEIHRLSGIKPPIEAFVIAVAMGHRLVPTLGAAEGQRQDLERWKPTSQVVEGDSLIINGVLKVRAWYHEERDLTEHVLSTTRQIAQDTPRPAEPRGFMAFLKGNGMVAFAFPTELGMKTVEDWARPALRDYARRMGATAICVVSDESIAVCAPDRHERRTITVDVQDTQAVPPTHTYVASTGEDGTLGDWSEDRTLARFPDLLG